MSYHTQILAEVIAFVGENPESTATFVVALAAAAGHYSKTGKLPIGRLPFRATQDIIGELSDRYFGTKRPRGVPGLLVEASPDELNSILRNNHFESVDLYSYEYEGEVLNLRRPNGLRRQPSSGDVVPMELHARVFNTDAEGKVWVLTHDEASRFEAWGDHYRETVFSWDRGLSQMASVLSEQDIAYDEIESERSGDITVVN